MRVLLRLAILVGTVGLAVAPAAAQDTRDDVEITVFTGIAVDSFAATELKHYINKDDASTVREQLTAGFDFSYRLLKPAAGSRAPTLWLYGETIHGARSGEAQCDGDKQTTELCRVARWNRPRTPTRRWPSSARSTPWKDFSVFEPSCSASAATPRRRPRPSTSRGSSGC